ncbi:MAG: tRNA lysidine(34) synthetase TilS [Rhizobiaceae bacterium]|nr:tRNA lysidine(34) synthetase TilS [Rhizobiaceae bacterium]
MVRQSFDLDHIFTGLSRHETLIVAVSGGSDSIALLMLASAWAQRADVDLQVVTVDHGLRPEAAAEAAFAASVSEGLELPHITLAWEGVKPSTGISSSARNARYRLMEQFAKDIDVPVILTAHTADDQAETVLMRNSRNTSYSQGRGLSGMARVTRLPAGTQLVRPLLNITRAELRSYLAELNQSWVEDPSNHDEAFERVRIRKIVDGDKDLISGVGRFAQLCGRERAVISKDVSRVLYEHLLVQQGPVFELDLAILKQQPKPHQVLILQILAALAGGGDYLVPQASITRFFDFPDEARMTMGNSIFERHAAAVRVYREQRNLPGFLIAPGEKAIWDGRLKITNDSSITYFCGPMDATRMQELEKQMVERIPVRPRAALGSTPFMNGDGDDMFLPFVKGFSVPSGLSLSIVCPAIEAFCPETDFPLLDVVKLVRRQLSDLVMHKF